MSSATEERTCERCHRLMNEGMAFALGTSMGDILKCLGCALRHTPMLRRSLVVAAVVGTALTALNHGDRMVTGNWASALLWKVPLTYMVPFVVATWGALSSARR